MIRGIGAEIWRGDGKTPAAEMTENQKEGEDMEERIESMLQARFGRGLDQCTRDEIFEVLMQITKEEMSRRPRIAGKKKLYYISAEFLIGSCYPII